MLEIVAQRQKPMGWEQRGGRSYYYRKTREGLRVRSEYVGGGAFGQLCAEADSDERLERVARRDSHDAARRAEAVIDRQLKDAEAALAAIVNAALRASGYHKHKGQWRKKRHG